MEEREQLEKMDLLRNRFNLTYAEARALLESANWDVIEATIQAEAKQTEKRRGVFEEIKVTGGDLVETLKRLLHQGNINRIIVRNDAGVEILNLPVNGIVVVTAIVPILTAVGAMVVVAMDYTVLIERAA